MTKGKEMQSVVTERKRSRLSAIPDLTEEDFGRVWDAVSDFISKSMTMQKGVAIPTLGIFTFSQKKLEVENNKFVSIQRPVFILSEKFAMTHALRASKPYNDGQIPILPLNFAAISHEIDFDRDTVERGIKEVLLALSRSVKGGHHVEFTFPSIGKLLIKNSNVKMKFYKDFLQNIDSSGAVAKALRNRPETSDSVISRTATSLGRLSTPGNTVYLPRINPGNELFDARDNENRDRSAIAKGKATLSVIMEDMGTERNDYTALQEPEVSTNFDVSPKESCAREKLNFDDKKSNPQGPTSPVRLSTAPGHFMLNSLHSDVEHADKRVTIAGSAVDNERLSARATTAALKPIKPMESSEHANQSHSFVPTRKAGRSKPTDKTCSSCVHEAGQELCYLCYQRDRRNIPVFLHEERKRKELEEDRVLHQYQRKKDYDAILKYEDTRAANRIEAQKIAAFNLGVAEAVKDKKNRKSTSFNRSFVFNQRPLSPSISLTQQKYQMDLAEQVVEREKNILKANKEKDLLEKLEQIQLAKDLTVQREQYLRNKRLQSEEYKRALDTQLRFKPLPITIACPESDQPYFGKQDMNHNKMFEKRAQARKLFEDQLNAVAEKKRSAILNDLKAQREESMMLTRAKTDLMEESIRRNREQINIRRDLEDTWFKAAKMKESCVSEEKKREKSPGILLHEQCSKYQRCKGCRRKMPNCGESNVWCESRYLSGSRIMV